MASTLNYPYFPIPPPSSPAHPIYPPPPPPPLPPHVMPPPPPFHPIIPPPPHVLPPSPDNGPTVIIVVFISLGCIFFLALCFFALWCLIKKRKKAVQETDIIRVDEHLKVKEAIVEGPHGTQTVVLSIEEDKHIEEETIKNEKLGKNHLHAKSGEITNSTTSDFDAGESSTNLNTHHHLEYKP